MGRTNPTFRDALRALRDRWAAFRRALRRRDQARFDRLFEYASAHADAAGYLNRPDTPIPVLFSIDLEQERRLDELAARVDDLEARLDGRDTRTGEREPPVGDADPRRDGDDPPGEG